MTILVTGGAGFIGSHLIDYLFKDGHDIVCVDDLSLGKKAHISHHLGRKNFQFIHLDILCKDAFDSVFKTHSFDTVFHMAANSDIPKGVAEPSLDLEKTFLTTFAVLECMIKYNVRDIVFASSSAIYGERSDALKEDSSGPYLPISSYGAAKTAAEAYISALSHNFSIRAWVFRFPNVVGPRATHGVVLDFINKLQRNPTKLEILGDGTQEKPYMYVEDLVEGILYVWKTAAERFNCFNIGVESRTSVAKIAEIVSSTMGLRNVSFIYTGSERGWIGDVPRFRYDLSKIHALGWKAQMSSDEAVKRATRAILNERQ